MPTNSLEPIPLRVYTIKFNDEADYRMGLELLPNARIAAAGLHSEAALRIDVHNWYDDDAYRIVLDASCDAGMTVLKILTTLLDYEIDPNRFEIKPATASELKLVNNWKQSKLD